MEIPKDMILKLLRERGQGEEADKELPDQVDTEQHKGLLDKFGLDVGDLMKLVGGGGGGLGGLGGKLGL